MPVIQFKGKTAIESYHHTVPHHTLEFDPKLSVLPKGEKLSRDGTLTRLRGQSRLTIKVAHGHYHLELITFLSSKEAFQAKFPCTFTKRLTAQ